MASVCGAAPEACAKAETYNFLAEILSSHPTEESVRAMCQMGKELGIPCHSDFSLEELDREYMDLFIVPNPRYVAPYESVFRDEWPLPSVLPRRSNPGETGTKIKGLLMGESTLKVRNTYLQAGVCPAKDLPDHIGNELRFIAYTWLREAEAPADEAASWRKLRENFRREHLLKWIGEIRQKIAERDGLGYYRLALQAVEAVLQTDAD